MYNNFLDLLELDDSILGFRTKPLSLNFSTPSTKDIEPVAPWKKNDEGNYETVIRMVGITPDDVNVEIEDYGIHVYGESNTFDQIYSQNIKIGVAREIKNNIDEIVYNVKNGMCKITLIMIKHEEKAISIKRV